MEGWSRRPTEIAHLLNPAFCALLLTEGVRGFAKEAQAGLPYPLIFVVIPVVLHKATRDALPKRVSTKMHPWLESHQEVQVGFARRCASVVGHTQEAMIYGVASGFLQVANDGRLNSSARRFQTPGWPAKSEPAVCIQKALFVGRWMAHAGQTATIYAMWGIRP